MIEQELAQRLVAGEELAGADAAKVMEELTTIGPWRIWVQTALAFLEAGQPASAEHVLRVLLANSE